MDVLANQIRVLGDQVHTGTYTVPVEPPAPPENGEGGDGGDEETDEGLPGGPRADKPLPDPPPARRR